jgi:hypothetical protein
MVGTSAILQRRARKSAIACLSAGKARMMRGRRLDRVGVLAMTSLPALPREHTLRVHVEVAWLMINLSKPMLYLDHERCKPD